MQLIKFHGMPGTGKTTALLNVIIENKYDLEDITFCTFRRSVANEIKEKLGAEKNSRINTIHGVVLRLLRQKLGGYEVFNDKDKTDFFRGKGIPLDNGDGNADVDTPGRMIAAVCTWLTHYGNIKEFPKREELYPITLKDEGWILNFYKEYCEFKQKVGRQDYDDMLKDGLNENIVPDTTKLFVDEFQDLSKPQFALYKVWESQMDRVYLAGDPYQSIQGWAGGTPDFWASLKGGSQFLDKSYRLYQNNIDFAWGCLRGQNPPWVRGVRHGDCDIRRLSLFQAMPLWECFTSNVLHLFRSHYLYKKPDCVPLLDYLSGAGVPYYCNSAGFGWSEKDCELYNAILKFRGGDRNPECLKIIFGEMQAGVNKDLYQMDLVGWGGLEAQLKSNTPFFRGFKFNERAPRGRRLTYALCFNGMPIDYSLLRAGAGVRVMTIHAAKGLEADTVFLYNGMSQRSLRGKRVGTEDFMEEQRVWFVGASRSRENLFVVDCPNSVGGKWIL